MRAATRLPGAQLWGHDPATWLLIAATVGGSAIFGVAAAVSPFLAVGAVLGALLTVFALQQPLALVALMLVVGQADLSFLTGGFKSHFGQYGGLDMNGIRLIGMTAALTLVVLADRRIGAQVLRPAALLYTLLLAYCAVTLVFSPAPVDGARLLLKIAYPLLVFLVIAGLSPTRGQLDRVMDAVLIGAAVLCLVINPLYLLFGDFERVIGGWVRLRGLGVHQNPFAFYLTVVLVISFVRFTTRRQLRYLLLSAVCGGWMVLTITRIAFLAVMVALLSVGVVSAVIARQTRILVGALIIGGVLAVPFAPPVLERTFGFVPAPGELLTMLRQPQMLDLAVNWEGRLALWAVVFQAFLASPWLGLGLGGSTFALRVNFPIFSNPVVHNDYLRLLADTGLTGFVLYTGAVLAWLGVSLRAARIADRTAREYALPAIGSIAAVAVIGLTDNAFDYYGQLTQYVGYLCGGAAAAAASVAGAAASDPAGEVNAARATAPAATAERPGWARTQRWQWRR